VGLAAGAAAKWRCVAVAGAALGEALDVRPMAVAEGLPGIEDLAQVVRVGAEGVPGAVVRRLRAVVVGRTLPGAAAVVGRVLDLLAAVAAAITNPL
jgi:hypothetical protein